MDSYTDTSLTGLNTALELGLLKVNDSVFEVNQYVNNTLPIQPELKAKTEPKGQPSRSPESDQLVAEYSDVFQGIENLKISVRSAHQQRCQACCTSCKAHTVPPEE